MKMPTPSLSVRLPDDTRARLDQAAKSTHRSRSFLVKEALELYFSQVVDTQAAGGQKSPLEKLRELKGFGAKMYGARSVEEIDAQVREFRGDE